ncbi:MAG: crosslink repair DNA glycosylase YcaQ family protein [Anaerolineae bacterium]|nr:winged helix DNA-binding domain-containing protein [Thermoflexales bacterium]MDW8406764.1 crosslink repair DNA glycosylase YcaQ family protein [Anaerolineae bacterium]
MVRTTSIPVLYFRHVLRYRRNTFRLTAALRLKTLEHAVQFVNERGFIFFWPIKDVLLPSLWVATAGDRPVADAHDDPGHVTWAWKDAMLGRRVWYYAKVLRRKSTLISLSVAPYFYALSENYGSPAEDYLLNYEQGLLSPEAKAIYEVLLREGPTDTVHLRRATGLIADKSAYRFERALAQLEADFKVLPIGVTRSGAWRYAFLYDIVARHDPELPLQAQDIRTADARRHLISLYLRSVGAAREQDIRAVFGWSLRQIEQALTQLVEAGEIERGVSVAGQDGTWLACRELLTQSR